jgi:hypothetical protein
VYLEKKVNHCLKDKPMQTITDEYMKEMLPTAGSYTLMILKTTPKRREPGLEKIIWEHGRRNFALRAEGVLAIVCPVSDGGDVAGIGIFITGLEETKKIMDEDPGVKAGIFVYELHACRGFPGDRLPE